jgi:hypothetical protein
MTRQVQNVPLKNTICSHCFPSSEGETQENINRICDQVEQTTDYEFWLDLCACYFMMQKHCVLLYMMTLITEFGTGLSLKTEDHGDFLYKNGEACRVNNKKVLIHIGYKVPHIIYTRYMIAKCCSRCTDFICDNCPMVFHHDGVIERGIAHDDIFWKHSVIERQIDEANEQFYLAKQQRHAIKQLARDTGKDELYTEQLHQMNNRVKRLMRTVRFRRSQLRNLST